MRRIDRRTLMARLGVVALAGVLPWRWTSAQQPAARPLRIGVLSSGEAPNRRELEDALLQGLREQGYTEGRNLFVERRYGTGELRGNAAALAAMHLDAVLTTCTPSTRLMSEASASTPIVMAGVSDPVRQGLIRSLAHPGRNVTGTTSQAEDILVKRLEMLVAVLPRRPTVAVLVHAGNPVHALGWDRLQAAAQALGVPLRKVELIAPSDLEPALAAVRAQVGAIFVMPDDPLMWNMRPQLVQLATEYRLPDFHWERGFVESGGLLSYGEDLRSSYRAGASYMGKIRNGADPGELPVEQPRRFDLVINLKAAQARGVTIPEPLLLRADDVIR